MLICLLQQKTNILITYSLQIALNVVSSNSVPFKMKKKKGRGGGWRGSDELWIQICIENHTRTHTSSHIYSYTLLDVFIFRKKTISGVGTRQARGTPVTFKKKNIEGTGM